MWKEKIGTFLGGFIFLLIFGGLFFFRGCGDTIQIYNPITMRSESWTPFKSMRSSRDSKRLVQLKIIQEFYEIFPEKEQLPQTNRDILETTDQYCGLKATVSSKEEIFAAIANQLQLVLEESSASMIADELSLNLTTIYALANLYSCFNSNVQVSIHPEAPKDYLVAVKEQGFDSQDVDIEYYRNPDATLLVAGYSACAEIYEVGFRRALESKRMLFSNTQNINVIYNSAHEYLCPGAQ